MIRKQTRERREYLYRKSLETKEKQIYDRKQKIKEALTGNIYIYICTRVISHHSSLFPLIEGKFIPSDLKKEADSLKKDIFYDEGQLGTLSYLIFINRKEKEHKYILNILFSIVYLAPTNHIDDEYSMAGLKDPKILITTSRDPSSRLQQFAKVIR